MLFKSRVSTWYISPSCHIWCHFAASFCLNWVAISSSLTSSVEWKCCLCFTWKAWSQRLLFVWPMSTFDLIEAWSKSIVPPWGGVLHLRLLCCVIIMIIVLMLLPVVLHAWRKAFDFFVMGVCKISHQLSTCQALPFAYEISGEFSDS